MMGFFDIITVMNTETTTVKPKCIRLGGKLTFWLTLSLSVALPIHDFPHLPGDFPGKSQLDKYYLTVPSQMHNHSEIQTGPPRPYVKISGVNSTSSYMPSSDFSFSG
jgi:hypothetical protein